MAANFAAVPKLERGLYSAGNELEIAIGAFPEFGAGMYLFDYPRNRAGRLTGPPSQTRLLSTFDQSGTAAATLSLDRGGFEFAGRRYRPVQIARRAFTAANGGIRLAAETATRADRKPRGTMLMVYGSGPGVKEGLDLWSFYFLSKGWSVVTYDKRGSGGSTGDWRLAGIEQLAQDAEHVIEALGKAKGPLGAWGISQAGWILPQLAAAGRVDFLILHAGAATTPGEQALDSVESELSAYGFDAAEIRKARDYYALDMAVSKGSAPWQAIEEAHRKASAAGAEWLLAPPAAADAPERTFMRLAADFDPAPYWRRSSKPLLAFFGEKDWIVPAVRNRPLLRSMLRSGVEYREVLLRGANHIGMTADTGTRDEYPKRTTLAPGYLEALNGWLAAIE